MTAHRLAWVLTWGEIPGKLHVLHTCDNPPCMNPDHLFVGTNADNVRDRHAKGRTVVPPTGTGPAVLAARTHCPAGHAYDEANTYRWRNERRCRMCVNAHSKIYRARKAVSGG